MVPVFLERRQQVDRVRPGWTVDNYCEVCHGRRSITRIQSAPQVQTHACRVVQSHTGHGYFLVACHQPHVVLSE
ncbi:hypothetical protein EYF80_013823 [Liparis tanakae]|uniref:Uncharacterized protein n=1 Tax=Liparis tanakae TaxID=230148 RepID=A0A4Z2IDM3_9TELE|nr:hypothetical protein EYF80_013823 [Liparis tanakae]